jgi:hypothetical protein
MARPTSPTRRVRGSRRRSGALVAVPSAGAMVAGLLATGLGGAATVSTMGTAHGAELPQVSAEAPIFQVTAEGLDGDQAQALAERAGIRNALRRDGTFAFTNAKSFGRVPMLTGAEGKDEDGRRTLARRLDLERLKALEPLNPDKAVSLAHDLLPLPEGFETEARPSHTQLTLSGVRGKTLATYDLDTTVNIAYRLGDAEVTGPGMRTSITFGPRGGVQGLTMATRSVEKAGYVGIVGPDTAQEQCRRLHGANAPLAEPELVYFAPRLTGAGKGSVSYLLPHYACQVPDRGTDTTTDGKLVPAAPELTPFAELFSSRDGTAMLGELKVSGGQEPYRIQWSSSSRGVLKGTDVVEYATAIRGRKPAAETLTATVTDANGITTSVSSTLGAEGGKAEDTGYGGLGGELASVGIENTVDEWQCAQDSAAGFKSVMQAKGHSVKFDWRGMNAWESDFKKTSAGGFDSSYVDSVDAQWYTGHGSPGGITFKNTSHQDGDITPSDVRWGDNYDLEWMQLESCQVLRDTNGANDYFARWAPAFDGLHLLNGFDTNANCIPGGTGRRFAEYLFPRSFLFLTFPALTVQQAWRQMATDLEPSGRVWRSISPARSGWVTNLDDKFWGQGAVGPDIPRSQIIGYVAISGTV